MNSKRLLLAAALALLFPALPAHAEGPAVNGGGSSFAALEIDQWRADVARKPLQLKINYVSQGSTFGRLQYASGTLDFGASDIQFQPGELTPDNPRSSFVYVPVSAGGIGFMYNLVDGSGQRVTDLKLTRKAACRIFSEPGMKWNDPELVTANPRLQGVDREIRPVVRQDGSGTSFVFSEFCIAVAQPTWQAFIDRLRASNEGGLSDDFKAGRPVSNWPTGWGRVSSALAADGVANAVADSVSGKDAITYNEAGFAKVRDFPNALVQNAAGRYLLPEEEAVTVALGYAVPNTPGGQENGTFTLNYSGPDERAYFPSTYSYVIAQTTGAPADKGEVIAKFLCYAVTKGQEAAVPLGYARLSSVLVDLSLRQVSRIPGYPGKDACVVASSAAPPPPVEPKPAAPGATTTTVKPGTGGPSGPPGSPSTTVAGAAGAGSGGSGSAASGGTQGTGGTGTGGSGGSGGGAFIAPDGSVVLADGTTAPEGSVITEDGSVVLADGTVIAADGSIGSGGSGGSGGSQVALGQSTGGGQPVAAAGDAAQGVLQGAVVAALVSWVLSGRRRSSSL